MSRAIALGQILLLEKKNREYADVATDIIGPLLIEMLKPAPAGGRTDFLDATVLTEFTGQLALLPLGASEFLSRLPEKQRRDMLGRWEKLSARTSGRGRAFVDLVLCGLYKSLGREKEWHEAASHLKSEPAGNRVLPIDGEIGQAIVTLRGQMQALLERRWP